MDKWTGILKAIEECPGSDDEELSDDVHCLKHRFRQACRSDSDRNIKELIEQHGVCIVKQFGGLDIADNIGVIDALIKSIPENEREEFLFSRQSLSKTRFNNVLHRACCKSNIEVVRYCIMSGYFPGRKIIAENGELRTALHMTSDAVIFRLLIDALKADSKITVEKKTQQMFQVHEVTIDDYRDGMLYIVTHNAVQEEEGLGGLTVYYPNSIDVNKDEPSAVPSVDKLSLLPGNHGKTALHWACECGKSHIPQLIELSDENQVTADWVSLRDAQGFTALHYAIEAGADMVTTFLNALPVSQQRKLMMQPVLNTTTEWVLKSATDCIRVLECKVGPMPLHSACENGQVEVVIAMLNMLPEWIMLPDNMGFSPLQLACEKRKTGVVNALMYWGYWHGVIGDLMLPSDEKGFSALHLAVKAGDINIVKALLFWSKEPTIIHNLIMVCDNQGCTALHHATNADIASLLINSLPADSQRKLMLCTDKGGRTALHLACKQPGCSAVVRVLIACALSLNLGAVFKIRGDKGFVSPLDIADLENTKLLLEACKQLNIADDVIFPAGHHTWRHYIGACHVSPFKDGVKGSRYSARKLGLFLNASKSTKDKHRLLTFSDLNIADDVIVPDGHHAWSHYHVACHVSSYKDGVKDSRYSARKLGLFLNALKSTEDKHRLLTFSDRQGRNIFHYLATQTSAPDLIETLELASDTETIRQVLCHHDNEGSTPIHLAVLFNDVHYIECLLQYLEHMEIFRDVLEQCNADDQNVFHLACLVPHCEKLLQTMLDYSHGQLYSLFAMTDKFKNNPLHYLSSQSQPKLFATTLMCLPRWVQRLMLTQKNVKGENCLSILNNTDFDLEYFQMFVLGDNPSIMIHEEPLALYVSDSINIPVYLPKSFLSAHYDERIWTVVRYALNQYDVILSVALNDSSFNSQSRARQILDSGHSLVDRTGLRTDGSPVIYIDERDPDMKQKDVHKILFDMDTPSMHGKPKMVIRRVAGSREQRFNLTPPGPDFIILTYTVTAPEHTSEEVDFINAILISPYMVDVAYTIDMLNRLPYVDRVSIDSTYARHISIKEDSYQLSQTRSEQNQHVIKKDTYRRALIVCYTCVYKPVTRSNGTTKMKKDRREGWQTQQDDAVKLLKDDLKFEVEEKYDVRGERLMEIIAEFSAKPADLQCLVIMGHGDLDGNISDINSESISVQDIIDALCAKAVDVPKLVFLSFCRGSLGKANRTKHSQEVKELPELLESSGITWNMMELDESEREQEWKEHPFPDVRIPLNCYLMYSTLPDSKSPRDSLFFKVMSQYVSGIIADHKDDNPNFSSTDSHKTDADQTRTDKSYSEQTDTDKTDANQAETDRTDVQKTDASQSDAHKTDVHRTDTDKTDAHKTVDVLNMFINVSALLREKSWFTQYTNHCYTVDRKTPRLKIEVGN